MTKLTVNVVRKQLGRTDALGNRVREERILHANSADNVYADKVHRLASGRIVLGVSQSWANSVDAALNDILRVSPDLRHVSIVVPKQERDVTRLFHSEDGIAWRQVPPPLFGPKRPNIGWIVRGAQEIDGDPAFTCELTKENLLLREVAGRLLQPSGNRFWPKPQKFGSLTEWVENRLRPILDYAGDLYVEGATSDESRNGRRQSLMTIERLIRRLRLALRTEEKFVLPADVKYEAQIESALERFVIRREIPFVAWEGDLLWAFATLTKARKKDIAKGVWADAARMPRDARFDTIYGALLRQAEGHPIFGDADYRRLEELLAEDLRAGFRVARLDGRLFIWSNGRWRSARADPLRTSEAEWQRGLIISRNEGRVIVPPHRRDGELVPGYTRNGPGEGPAKLRAQELQMRCIDRPIPNTNLTWLHAYHAWELGQT